MNDFSVFIHKTLPEQKGFTLIEMTMVLIILSLLLGGLMTPLSNQLEKNHRQETKRQLDKINEALIGFALVHGYLPCPDTNNDGQEDRTTQGCASPPPSVAKESQAWIGTLPWLNLGVGEQDSWSNRFTYAVSKSFTESSRTPLPAFSLQTEGTIQVVHGVDNTPAVVLSHGANTQGGFSVHGIIQVTPTSAAERENSNGDARFEYAPYNNDTVQGFDDQMVWISSPILKNRLLMAGRITP